MDVSVETRNPEKIYVTEIILKTLTAEYTDVFQQLQVKNFISNWTMIKVNWTYYQKPF